MKTKTFFTFLAIIFFALFSCKKDFETPTGGNKIEFGNTTVDSVSYSWVQITTQFTSTGGNTITQHGHCWSTETEPTIQDNHTSLGKLEKPKTFQSQIEELSSGTTYFIRSYFTYQNGTVYCNQETITTLKTGKPVIITSEVTDITLISAVCGGTVMSDSGLVVTARGVCWDTISDFNFDSCLNKTINGDSLGTFTSNITELTEGKDYFVKAYATNEKGTGYGDIKTFSTVPLSLPEVQTSNISGITINSAVCGGDVLSNGNGTVTSRGICWSTSENVSLENYEGITENGTGTGSFISNLTDLTDGTFYYVVAYAINEKGSGYGQVKSFQTVVIGAPTVVTSDVTDITTNSAQCGGNVTNSGNGTVTLRGVCWNTAGNPTLQNCIDFTENGSGLGVFNSSLSGLNDGTTYYVSAYATNEIGTSYGEVKTFNTIEITIPDVTTFEVTNITQNSAECGGNVTSNGNGTVIARGVCWNTTGDPTLTNCINYTTNGSGTGNFTSNITGLQENTIYYVAAYATNEKGTAYGLIKQFNTTSTIIPIVVTADVINITVNSAQCGGNVTNNGTGTVSARGVCWNTNVNPTLGNCLGYTTDGSGMGSYTSDITGISEGTTYYVTAYATNENGTGYGTIKQFTTLFTIITPTVETADVTNITSNSAQCGGNVTSNGNGTVIARGVCWDTTGNPILGNCLGYTTDGSGLGSYVSYITGLEDGTDYYVKAYATNEEGTAYGDIKSFTTIAITIPIVTTADVTNITTNSADCGGEVTSNGNGTVSARGVCWDSTGNPTLGNCLGYTTDGSGLGSYVSYITGLEDGTDYYVTAYATNEKGTAYGDIKTFTTLSITIPTVETADVTNITSDSAQCGGDVTSNGNGTVSARGVCWDTTGNPTLESNLGYTIDGSGLGSYISYLTGLQANTEYYVAAYATNEEGTAYGDIESFTTNGPCNNINIVNYEGQDYNTVEIGNQCWFKENLNIGTRINGNLNQTDNSIIEKYCYDDDELNCDEYGGLYQWDEMMQYTTTQGTQGICPSGWHIPTDEEWKILEGTVDSQYGVGDPEWDGTGYRGFDSGYNLKSESGWYNNGNGSDAYGFTALPGGYRDSNGNFDAIEYHTYIWSSTEDSSSGAWGRGLNSGYDEVHRSDHNKVNGLSVRCVKD